MMVLGILLIVSGAALLLAAVNVGRHQASFAENPYETDCKNQCMDETDGGQDAENEKLMQSEALALSGFCRILKIAGIVLCGAGLMALVVSFL